MAELATYHVCACMYSTSCSQSLSTCTVQYMYMYYSCTTSTPPEPTWPTNQQPPPLIPHLILTVPSSPPDRSTKPLPARQILRSALPAGHPTNHTATPMLHLA
ncbi:hypothetical protein I7I48_00862 [Histoplasma ohiense]|nr:hypothetical protein I7I48_00862 [Histoplasma ohiense (nom. inval.)]